MNNTKSVFLVAAVIFLASCATSSNTGPAIIDAYDADAYSAEQIATLVVPDTIYISELDGERMPSGYSYSGVAIRTLPGQHQAKINYGDAGHLSQQGSLKFDLKRPENYFLQLRKTGQGSSAIVQFDIHECGSENAKKAIQSLRKNSTGSFSSPCPKN